MFIFVSLFLLSIILFSVSVSTLIFCSSCCMLCKCLSIFLALIMGYIIILFIIDLTQYFFDKIKKIFEKKNDKTQK